jgi:hypothetical protein
VNFAVGQDGTNAAIRNQNMSSNFNVDATAERTAVSGKRTLLYQYYAVNLNCSPADWNNVSITQQPEHGKATISEKITIVSFPNTNPRSSCNGKSIKAKVLEYVPSHDYKGADEIAVEIINSGGQEIVHTFKITVK